jgi:hypothetical protein
MDIFTEIRRRMDRDLERVLGMTTSQVAETAPAPSIDALMASLRALDVPRPAAALRIVFDANAPEKTNERLFPPSRHRSARIRKKLIRRHGGEFRLAPAMWRVGDVVYAHPALRATIERQFPIAGAPL